METKKCAMCNEYHELNNMIKNKNLKDGFGKYCKECMKKKSIQFRINNPIQQMLSCTKSSAKKRNLDFNITIDDILIPEFCPYLGIKLEVTPGEGLKPNTPSIDRIDTNIG